MIASELLQQAYTSYRGKVAAKTPVWGSDKAVMALEIANRKQREWAKDPNQVWSSLFDIKTVSVIDIATLTYNLDPAFLYPSDFFTIVKINGDEVDISLTKPQHRLDNTLSVYIHGSNPKKVTFAGKIDSGYDGGTLKAPAYYLPVDMTTSGSVIAVDDPDWLVYALASELARNDPAKDDQFANLLGMANEIYSRMIAANNNIGFKQGGTIPYNMPQIGGNFEDQAFS